LARGAVFVFGVAAAAFCLPAQAQAEERNFDIPAQPANRAVLEFARQADIQIVAPGRKLRNVRTRSIRGQFEVREALEAMLEGTGIRIASYKGNTITLSVPRSTGARLARSGSGSRTNERAGRAAASGVGRDMDAEEPSFRAASATQVGTGYILVTGSRIKKSAVDSPVPGTVMDSILMEDLAYNNTAEIVDLIPQNIATQSDATSGLRFSADVGAAYANLRGLNPTFGTRTLTLVNSRRFVPTSDGGQVDLNLIPSILIARVEAVTGGASAAYGSDAVAGAVNIILDNQLDGFKAQAGFGQTSRGDGQSVYGAAAYGVNFVDDRGHFMIGGEYQHKRGIFHCAETRDWCAEGWTVFGNEATIEPGTLNTPANVSGYNVPGSSGYGLPNFVLGPGGGLVYNSPLGAIRNYVRAGSVSSTAFNATFPDINPPLAAVDKVFTADGQRVIDYDPGNFAPRFVGGLAQGGDNSSAYADQRIQTPLDRFTIYGAAEYELSDALKMFSELTYAERKSRSQSLTAATRSTMAIKSDNAFLPQEVVDLLDGAAFSLGKDVDDELDNVISVDAQVFRGLVGFSGGLFADWSWDTYYQYGQNKRQSSVRYSRHNDAFTMAIDAIEDPLNPGKIICRPLTPETLALYSPRYQAELLGLYADCVPLNLFGQGNMNPAAVDFAWRDVGEDFTYRQHVLAGSLQGTVASGWGADPVGLAAGFELRDEQGEVTHGGIDPSAYAFSFGLDYAGKIRVIEGFLESRVPVFHDSPLGDNFELSGAVRYTRNKSTDTLTNQSRIVNVASWKVGGYYEIGGLRLRGTHSRDIRAAGFRELFRKTAATEEDTAQGRVNNWNIQGPNQADAAPIFTGGNFGLSPEKANTTTLGAVIAPPFLPGFQVSLDWYQIKLKDAIANLNGQRVTDLCLLFDVLCDRLTFASPTNITRVDAGQANVGRIDIRGFDLEASYRIPLVDLTDSMSGDLSLRLLLNHQYDFEVTQGPGLPTLDYAGQSGPVIEGGDFHPTPKWLWNALIAYDSERFNATITVRHIGKGILNKEWVGPEDQGYDPTAPGSVSVNRVDAATYVNLALSYEIPFGNGPGEAMEIFGAVENLFDRDPPIAPGGGISAGATAYPTNPVFFDTFGMRWRAGVRLKL